MTKYLPKYILNVLLAATGASSAVLCIVTGFGFSVNIPVLVLGTLLAAMLFTGCFMWKKALWSLIPLALILLVLGLVTDVFAPISPTLTQLVHDILERFSTAYPNFSFAIPAAPEAYVAQSNTLLFTALSMLLAIWMAWGVGYRSCLISVAGTLPFLLLCVIINDTPPHVVPLTLLLTVWVTVLLSRERPGEPPAMDAIRVGLILFAVILFMSFVGTAYPKADTREKELPELVESFIDMLPESLQNLLERNSTGQNRQELGADTSTILDLTEQGTRDRSDDLMMQLSSTEVGPIYLRGAAKDIYTGSSWESANEASSADSVYAHTSLGTAFGTVQQGAVQIKNFNDRSDVLFVPYGFISCPSAEDISSDLRININEDDYIIYYWPGIRTLDLSEDSGYYNSSYDAYVSDTCLDLPEETRTTLYDLAITCGYDPEMTIAETVAWVASFIRGSGTYKLNVSRQPVNYDFAVYFLTESNEGYCVHFATAAAAMFRALGIPARYASGYRVTVTEANTPVDILDQDTHAWAEVYISGLGWIPVETTPGFGETSLLPQVEQPTAPPPSPSEEPAEPTPSEAPASPSPEETEAAPAEASPSPEVTDAPAGSTPVSSDSGGAARAKNLILIPFVLLILLVAAVITMVIRRSVVRHRRRKAFRHENPNQRVLNMWQYVERLVPWGAEPAKNMEALALKAKFSLHTITQEELGPYEAYVYKLAVDTASGLTRGKKFRFNWLSCLDLGIK